MHFVLMVIIGSQFFALQTDHNGELKTQQFKSSERCEAHAKKVVPPDIQYSCQRRDNGKGQKK